MKRNYSKIFSLVICLSLLAGSFACAGSGGKNLSNIPLSSSNSPSLEQVLSEIEALQAPADINPQLFQMLKDELSSALIQRAEQKIVSKPPEGDANKVNDLALAEQTGTQITLTWSYRNVGDYNQDGSVSISDIFTLADHFFHSVGDDAFDEVIDGDGSGKVDIGDVFPLADNFFSTCVGYRLEGAPPTSQTFTEITVVPFSQISGVESGRGTFSYSFDMGETNRKFRVLPVDAAGNAGPASNVRTVSTEPPTINGVSPLQGYRNQTYTLTAYVTGTQPFINWQWSFTDTEEWGTAVDLNVANPEVTLVGTPGEHTGSVHVENEFGSADFTFNFTIQVQGNPPNIIDVNPKGGAIGRTVIFTAQVTGDPPLEYSWDFGGGATPNTSTAVSPQVALSTTPNQYNASLTVTNPNLQASDTFLFTLTVTSGNNPPTVSISVSGNTVTAVANDPDFDKLSFQFSINPLVLAQKVFIVPSATVPPTYQYTQVVTLKNLSVQSSEGQIGVTVTDETNLTANAFAGFSLSGLTGPNNSINVAFSNDSPKVGDEITVLIYVYNLAYEFYQFPGGVVFDFTKNLSLVPGSISIGEIGSMEGEPDGIWKTMGVPSLNVTNNDLAAVTAIDSDQVNWYVNDQKVTGRWGVWVPKMAPSPENPAYVASPGIDGAVINLKLKMESAGTGYLRIYKTWSASPGGPYMDGTLYMTFVENPQNPPPKRYFHDQSYQDIPIPIS